MAAAVLILVAVLSIHNVGWPSGNSRVGAVVDASAMSVVGEPPKKVGSACLRIDEANQLAKESKPGVSHPLNRVKCEDDAAIATIRNTRRVYLFVRRGGIWFYYGSGTSWSGTDACDDMPRVIRRQLIGCDR